MIYNPTLAQEIQARIDSSKPTPWMAYTFARLSVQTPLATHERSWLQVMATQPTPGAGSLEDFEAALQGIPFWRTKAVDLAVATRCIESVMAQVDATPNDKDARAIIVANLPGVGLAKASFMLMLLGRMGVACIDTHMVKLLKLRSRPTTPKAYAYAESKLRATFGRGPSIGLLQWTTWVTHMNLGGPGHDVYFHVAAP